MTASPQEILSSSLEVPPAAEESPVRTVFLWQRLLDTEPVRLYLRPVLVVLLVLLTVAGRLAHTAPLLQAAGEALVAVGGWLGIEGVRASVFSPRTHKQAAAAVAAAAALGRALTS